MNGTTLSRVLTAVASMMFAAISAAQLPPQIGSMYSQAVEVRSIFPSQIPIINPNTGVALTNVNITVNLPAGLTGGIGPTYFSNPSCTGTITAGPTVATVTNGVLPAGAVCELVVYHQVVTAGIYGPFYIAITSSANPTTPVESTQGIVLAYAMPTASVSFSPARIAPAGVSTLSLTFANPDPNFTVDVIAADPIGLGTLVAGTPIVDNPPACASGRGAPYVDAGNSLIVSYASLPPGGTCIVSVNVTGPALGGGVISEGHPVPAPSSTTFTPFLHYVGPPTYNIYPLPVSIPQGALTVVGPELGVVPLTVNFPPTPVGGGVGPATVTVTNTGALPLAISGPLVRVGTFSVSSTCPESPATLAPSASCSLSISFSPISPGPQSTSITVQSDGGTATIAVSGEGVLTPPAVYWWLNPPSVFAGAPSFLQLRISNANGASFDSPGFTYSLPAGLQVASLYYSYSASPCSGVQTPPMPGDTSFTVNGVSVPTSGSCDYIIEVTSTTPGTYRVSMAPGNIVGSVFLLTGVTNAASNTASLTVTVAPAPVLSVSPAPPGPIGFGNVTVGSVSAAQTVTLTNAGNASLTFSAAPAVTGAFTVNTATATPCPATLPAAPSPGNACTLEAMFTPAVVGPASGTLSIASDGGTAVLGLTGTGDPVPAPIVSLSPAGLAFPSQSVGSVSSPQTVMLQNAGTRPLAISVITSGGDFAHRSTCPIAPSTLAPELTCEITVTFSPLITGGRIGTLTITSNAAGSPHQVGLSGTGTAALVPSVSVAPAPVPFPATRVGAVSGAETVTVTNTGTAPLVLSRIDVLGGGFGLVRNNCAPELLPRTSCTLMIVFIPTSEGTISGVLRIASNAPESPMIVDLSGTGTPAAVATLTVSPPLLDFGPRSVGTTSPAMTVTLGNTGEATAIVWNVSVSGDYAQTNYCVSVPAGGACTISVTFTPVGAGPRPGSLSVSGSATNLPLAIPLAGTGVPRVPMIELSSSGLSFGNTLIWSGGGVQRVIARNVGGAPLTITGLRHPSEFPVWNGCPAVVPAGESCTISVAFQPGITGMRTGRLDVESDASNGTVGLTLAGTGCRFSFRNRNPSLICQ